MAKDATVRNSSPPRKGRASLSGFFNRILPSHRAEQGGTARSHDITDDSDSAYIDLGMNPNDLTGWNLAQERRLKPQASEPTTGSQHQRGHSWSIQRGRPRLHDGIGQSSQASQRAPSLDLVQPTKPIDLPGPSRPSQAQNDKSQPITRDEVRNMLKTKEDTRKHRLSLKESGDWLGVQGADPYSGEFAVLTPTSTVSSETTPPSTKKRLAELSRRQTTAKLAYEQAKLEEETEREKALLQKGQSKLEKMKHVKEELRQQQLDIPTWSQHKRRWSSAAEPDLSPIPQSVISGKFEGSEYCVVPVSSPWLTVNQGSDEAAAGPIRNFSRPSISNGVSAVGQPKLVELSGNSENTEPSKHDRRKNRSTDTVIHKALPNMKSQDTPKKSTRVVYPSVFSNTDDSSHQEQNNEKPFLWRRRRRMTDPGNSGKRPNFLMTNPPAGKTQGSLVSDSAEPPPPVPQLQPFWEFKNHFPDLHIPDSHLDLMLSSERTTKKEKSPATTAQDRPLVISARPTKSSQSEAQSVPALRIATNHSVCPELQTDPPQAILDTKGATATSSQSNLKGNTKPLSIYRRLIPIRNSSFQAKPVRTQAPRIQPQNTNQTRNHIDKDVPQDIVGFRGARQKSTTQESSKTETLDGDPAIDMRKCSEKERGESVSTPTIIITGSGPDPQRPFEGIQSRMEAQKDFEGSTVDSDETLVTPSSRCGEQAPCSVSTTEKEWSTTSSRPTTPQSDSESFVLARETPETDTASTSLATSRVDPTSPVQRHKACRSYQNPINVLMKSASENLEKLAGTSLLLQHEASREKPIQAEELRSMVANPPCHRRGYQAQVAHRCQAPSGHKEAMIQEAARIAMRRSRAKEVVTTKSCTPSRTPSPRTRETHEASPAVPSRRSAKVPQESSGGVGADFPSCRIGSADLQPLSPWELQGLHYRSPGRMKEQNVKEWRVREEISETQEDIGNREHEESYENTEPGAAVMLVSLLITVCMVLFGLARAWWIMVKPAFDQRSDIWRRRRGRVSTWVDISVFAAAGVFCVGGALLLAGGVRTGFWIILQILQL
ncbi:hypothetical protein EKO27_g2588 [Xylaria grammica]|uniref:Uncharacterized protein n=1 Tax=Xylaria grammica TaxID=363999 RepID=A0A439DDM3_9PEZI|nr:hypothetical protein EKO27_g2588 [Xylaria grammica]